MIFLANCCVPRHGKRGGVCFYYSVLIHSLRSLQVLQPNTIQLTPGIFGTFGPFGSGGGLSSLSFGFGGGGRSLGGLMFGGAPNRPLCP